MRALKVELSGWIIPLKSRLVSFRQVSWVRRIFYLDPNDETQPRQELQLLTVGTNTFVADLRYSVDFQFPNNFRLLIANVTKRDEGIYEVRMTTHAVVTSHKSHFQPFFSAAQTVPDLDASAESHPILPARER